MDEDTGSADTGDSFPGTGMVVLDKGLRQSNPSKFPRVIGLREEIPVIGKHGECKEFHSVKECRHHLEFIHHLSQSFVSVGDLFLVFVILGVCKAAGHPLEIFPSDEAQPVGDLFDAGHVEPLTFLDGLDVVRGFEKGVMSPTAS